MKFPTEAALRGLKSHLQNDQKVSTAKDKLDKLLLSGFRLEAIKSRERTENLARKLCLFLGSPRGGCPKEFRHSGFGGLDGEWCGGGRHLLGKGHLIWVARFSEGRLK